MAEAYSPPELADFPHNALYTRRQHCASALFWRFASVLDIAAHLAAATWHEPECLSLASIQSWERGRTPVIGRPSAGNALVTIDSRGIRNIERFL